MYEKIIDMEIKRYYSFTDFSLKNYGKKIYKIALNLNFGCPNRDGKVSTGGCIFCANGSGDFASLYQGEKIQLKKTDKQSGDALYIGYFQAYTNTYADINTLRFYFTKALEDDLLAPPPVLPAGGFSVCEWGVTSLPGTYGYRWPQPR